MSHLQKRLVGKLTPLLASLILASTVHAGASTAYGDWHTGVSDDGSYSSASTVNLNGDVLGEFCYVADKHCEWRFSTGSFQCIPGGGVALVNSGIASNSIATDCLGEVVQGSWANRISKWTAFESLVNNDSQEVAFVIAANEGTSFRVFRFSLRGMTAAAASIGGAINPNGPNAANTLNAGTSRVARGQETL